MAGPAAITPITGSPATRFALDQAAARALLARARRRWYGLRRPDAPPCEDWAADPQWNPRELPDDELPNLEALIVAAQEAGAIIGALSAAARAPGHPGQARRGTDEERQQTCISTTA